MAPWKSYLTAHTAVKCNRSRTEVSGLNSSVDFELLVWVEWGKTVGPNTLRSDFMILIYNALYRHGIQIPFPQPDLYVKQMPSETLNKG